MNELAVLLELLEAHTDDVPLTVGKLKMLITTAIRIGNEKLAREEDYPKETQRQKKARLEADIKKKQESMQELGIYVPPHLTPSQWIVETIKEGMELKGLNRRQFAAFMGKMPNDITRWLSGYHNFTLTTLLEIEEKLGIRLLNTNTKPQQDETENY
jgi:ribosome-binding protein aMBF1 (putative translation factor)